MKEDGRGVIGDREGFRGGESVECRAGEAEAVAVVGVRCREVVARVDSVFH